MTTIGIRADGTVVAVGNNRFGQCDVSNWTEIVEISVQSARTIGLKADGTVVSTGYNTEGECNVSDWTDIVNITTQSDKTFGVKSDGTVVFTGRAYFIQDDLDINLN